MKEIANTTFTFGTYPTQEASARKLNEKFKDSIDLLQRLSGEICTKIVVPVALLPFINKVGLKNQQLTTSTSGNDCSFLTDSENCVTLHIH